MDTALRTADSGYLTRRLVDVCQELIINDVDPFEADSAVRGIWLEDIRADEPNARFHLETRLFSRTLAEDVALSDGTVMEAGRMVGEDEMVVLRDDPTVDRVRVLSPLSDDSPQGVAPACYGMSLATGKPIEGGEAVGVIAAQSIGEPGTQLTMRTFHTGGVAGKDIAAGLPRVVELFEARTPKGKATLARISGVVRVGEDEGRGREVTVVAEDGTEEVYLIPGSPVSRWSTVRRSGLGTPLLKDHATPRSCWRSRECGRPSSTWWTRFRRSTGTRVCRFTTSTSNW